MLINSDSNCSRQRKGCRFKSVSELLNYLLESDNKHGFYLLTTKGPFIRLSMQSSKKSAEQRQKRLRCNWSWANVYRFCWMALKPVH